MDKSIRSLTAHVKAAGLKADDAPYGWVEGIANKFEVDRYGELVLPTAFKNATEKFMKNPVMSIGHRIDGDPSAGLPAGTVLKLWQDQGGDTYFRARFANTPEAQKVRGLYVDGDMRAFSVQFLPAWHDKEWSRDPSPEEMKAYGPTLRIVIQKIDLIEIACCPVGVNAGSLATAAKSLSTLTKPKSLKPGATMKKSMSDEGKGHLAKMIESYTAAVGCMSSSAEALEELTLTYLHLGAYEAAKTRTLLLRQVEDVGLVLLYECFSDLKGHSSLLEVSRIVIDARTVVYGGLWRCGLSS